VIELLLKP